MIQLYTGNDNNRTADTAYTHPLIQYLSAGFEKLIPLYQLTDKVTESDFCILPQAIEYFQRKDQKKYLKDFIFDAIQNKKPILLFSTGDFGSTISYKNSCTLRLGGFESKLDNRTEIMPPFFEDPLLFLNKQFRVFPKTEQPHIGFVGNANGGVLKYLKEVLLFVKGNGRRLIGKDMTDYQKFYPSSYYRYLYLKRIQSNNEIVANFILRKKYRAGAVTQEDKRRTSLEFYGNIFESQYVFCLRGAGNFSVRFYETLAMGRIPVLINTDCRLPFRDQINWEQHCLLIDEKEVEQIAEKIINFHNSLSEEEFQLMQQGNRTLWETCFTKENFFVQYAKVAQEYLLNKRND